MTVSAHRPRLDGDHPYKTTTKFQRGIDGNLLRDEDGYPLPVLPVRDTAFGKTTTTFEERAATRERVAMKAEAERRAIAKMRKKIEKRQSIGDPNCVQSRDEDFPLLAVLRRDKAHGMIAAVLAYRRLFALCEAEPLKGQSYGQAIGMEREYESRRMRGEEEVNEAAAQGFTGKRVHGGEIVYERRVRKSSGAYDIPAKRILPAEISDDGTPIGGRTESLHIKINEDTIVDYIDSRPRLAKIRAALGPLLEPVEDAVLGGQTLGWIGQQDGYSGRAAEMAGKALVFRGLTVIDGFLGARKYTAANDNYLIENRKIA